MNDVVVKHAVTWVASAGNNGPALCTVDTPPDISKTTIIGKNYDMTNYKIIYLSCWLALQLINVNFYTGVGAYVSPDMMTAEYSMLHKLSGNTYTWSSRGPTIDGGRGISVCAPGGALTSVPGYLLRGSGLNSGTSMAAPHVAGACGWLYSYLKLFTINNVYFFQLY